MKYFGTDGFRGVANEGLNVEHAYKIGRFVGWYYGARVGKKARVVLGKDTRRSSYMFESALTSQAWSPPWRRRVHAARHPHARRERTRRWTAALTAAS
jgi:hypothetical protein